MLIRNNNKKTNIFRTHLNSLLFYNTQNLFSKALISNINKNFAKTNISYLFDNINIESGSQINNPNSIFQNRIFSFSTHNKLFYNKNIFDSQPLSNNHSLGRIQKYHFSGYYNNSGAKSNYDFNKINQNLNSDVLFQIFEKCDLEPKAEGTHIRLKVCPLCDKPHNYDKTNMHTCCVNTENMLFNCFRCGSKGHVIRIIKFLRKKFNLDLINDILDTGNFSSTEGEDSAKRMKGENNSSISSRDISRNNYLKDSSANGYSDFSDLEFYKVNKGKKTNPNAMESIARSDNEIISDSETNNFNIGSKFERSPGFSPLLKKSENTLSNKKSMNSTKNPFSVSYANNTTNNNESNKTLSSNGTSDSSKSSTSEKKNFKFISSNSNNNIINNNNNNNNVNSTSENKPKFSISPISSISGANLNPVIGKNTSFKISISNINLINEMFKRINSLQDDKLLIVKDYLINERKLSEEVLKFYKIGASFEKFKNTDFDFITLPTVIFPMFYPTDNASYLAVDKNNLRNEVYECLNCDMFFLSRTKVRAIGKEFKHFMRIEPPGAVIWGLFGLDTVPEDAKEIVITEGEYDAMSVYQNTGMPTVSLPNGATNLPTQMLSFFNKFKKIYLWMDADQAGKIASENFAKKLGETKTLVVNTRKYDPEGPKDANDAMRMGKSLKQYLDEAKPLSGDNIVTVTDLKSEVIQFLTSYDQYSGYKSISFDFFNQKLKGLRMGEFSILTGETGSGKTTFLTQLSLDFLQQRVPTLWGSFEIKNDKLISLFLMQLARKNLRQAPVKEIEYYAEMLEKFPLYLLKFHGSQNIDEIMNTMNYAVYNFDIQNIVLDNLQFMVGTPSAGKQLNKFDYQDEIIQKMRKFATEKNIHLTLVIHPKKTDEALKISSIFGTAKASQEADNIYIIQAYKGIRIIEIAKNRFDGATGKIALAFDTEACRYFELEESEFTDYTRGVRSIQDIIGERVKMHGKVEYKHKEYAGVNYDKIVEFNKNYQEKLMEMKHLSDSLHSSSKFAKKVEEAKEGHNENNQKIDLGNKVTEGDGKFVQKDENKKEAENTLICDNARINAVNEFEDGLVIGNEEDLDLSILEDEKAPKAVEQNKESGLLNKTKVDAAVSKNPESEKIGDLVVKTKKASSKKSSILQEMKNPLSEKFEEKKRIPKNTRKLMDIELQENSSSSSKPPAEKEKHTEIKTSPITQEKPIYSDISDFSEIDPIIMNSEVIYDEKTLFQEVNDAISTMIKEEVLIRENKTITNPPYANENYNDVERNDQINKIENANNEEEANKMSSAKAAKSTEKPKRESKRTSKKESSKTINEESEKVEKQEKKAKKKKEVIKPEEPNLNENLKEEETIKVNTEVQNNDVKFELNEEEKKTVFNNEIYNQEIEKETINNINNKQESIFPLIGFVENFHSPSTQEKSIANNYRNRRNNEIFNRNTLFSPIKYSSNTKN